MVPTEKKRRTSSFPTRGLPLFAVVGFFFYVDYFLLRRIQPERIRGPLILSMSAVLSVIFTAVQREELLYRKSWRYAPLWVWVLLGLANSVVWGFVLFCIGSQAAWWINREDGQVWARVWLFLTPIIINGGFLPKQPWGRILYPKRLLYYCGVFGILSLLYLGSTLDIWGKGMLGWMFIVGLSSGLVFRVLEGRLGLKFDRVYEDEVVGGDRDD